MFIQYKFKLVHAIIELLLPEYTLVEKKVTEKTKVAQEIMMTNILFDHSQSASVRAYHREKLEDKIKEWVQISTQ